MTKKTATYLVGYSRESTFVALTLEKNKNAIMLMLAKMKILREHFDFVYTLLFLHFLYNIDYSPPESNLV